MSVGRLAARTAVVFVWLAGLWLANDSLTFALRPDNQRTGQAGGCYTFLDDALGRKSPSDAVRWTQLAVAITVVLGMPVGFITRKGISKWRQLGLRTE
jgi:hypothetical protein